MVEHLSPDTSWHLDLPFLPPGKNHRRGRRKDGRDYIIPEAESIEDRIRGEIIEAGFKSRVDRCYEVVVVFTFPSWQADLDGKLPALIDACFGHTHDHRVIKIIATKQVLKRKQRTQVWIREVVRE